MSDKKSFRVVILWEDEIRDAGIKLNELVSMNLELGKKKDEITEEEREQYHNLETATIRLCYTALNGVDDKCAITVSRKPIKK